MPEIPEKLKWYQPQNRWCRTENMPFTWRIVVDDMTGCVEIKRAPLFSLPWAIVSFVVASIFFGVGYWCFYNGQVKAGTFMTVFPAILFPFMLAVGALGVWEDSTHWNGPLRFRFTSQNGELFFAKENVTYKPDDYTKLILGCVGGADRRDEHRNMDIHYTIQFFMLILDKNDEWQRYNLADDNVPRSRGRGRFKQVVDQLQPLLLFGQFVDDYSEDECYAQQNGNVPEG
jgi:hypothetical protein